MLYLALGVLGGVGELVLEKGTTTLQKM